jgi:GT2 family glycosyltransferase
MAKVAVVILNWNGRSLLERFVPLLVERSHGDVALIVADNGSQDDSLEWLAKHFPLVQVIRLDRNYGFAEGYNRALERVDAEYFVLLNSDVEVGEGWLDPLVKFMEEHSAAGGCMPKIRSLQSRDYFEYAGAVGGFIDKYGYTFCRGRLFNVIEKDVGQYDTTVPVFWASGACMMVRASVWRETGGLDPDFFAHMEEIDLCWRMQLLGYGIFVVPSSVVWHLGGATLNEDDPRKTYLNFRNNLYLLYKNLAVEKLFWIMILRLLLDGVAALKFLAGFEFGHHLAVWKAHLSFWKNLRAMKEKRKKIIRRKELSPRVIYDHSLVVRFFLHGEKRFTDLKDVELLEGKESFDKKELRS